MTERNEHPMTRATREAMEACTLSELIGLRAFVAEEVISAARRMYTHLACATFGDSLDSLSLALQRLDAVEERIKELSPAITFSRRGEALIK